MSTDIQRILDAATEAKVNFGFSNPEMFVKSFFESLRKDDLFMEESDSDDASVSVNFSHAPSGSVFFTPNRSDRSGKESLEPPTPTLSLPDSFDGYYGSHGTHFGDQCYQTVAPIINAPCKRCAALHHSHTQDIHTMEERLKKVIAEQLVEYDTETKRLKKIYTTSQENFRLEVSGLEDHIQRLSTQVNTESTLRRLSEQQASLYVKAHEDLNRSQTQLEELRVTVEHQRLALAALTDSEQSSRRAAEDSIRLRDLLALDKSFLQQEVRSLESKVDERTRAAEIATSKAQSLDLRVAQLTDQLLTLQLNARSGFDDRLEKEVIRLREDSSREMESMKNASREILDRENRVLKEAKQTLDSECAQLRRRNDTLSAEANGLRQELSAANSERSREVGELRAELKVKMFELTSLGVNYEERMNQKRQVDHQLDTVQQELIIHKQALLRLESDSHHQVSALQSELDRASSRLRAYEVLEEEVDDAVMRTAAQVADGGIETEHNEGQRPSDFSGTQRLVQSVRGIPCHPERRVRQALYLAQRLMATERERDAVKTQLVELSAELARAQDQANAAQESLNRSAQPTTYLVSKLRDEERLKLSAMTQCRQLTEDLKRRKQKQLAAESESHQLRERLTCVLENHGELETVKNMLRQVYEVQGRRHQASSSSSDSSDDDHHDQLSPPRSPTRLGLSPARQQKACVERAFGLSPEMVAKITSPPSHSKRQQQAHHLHQYFDSKPSIETKD